MYIYVCRFGVQTHIPSIQVPLSWFRPLQCSARGKTKSEKFWPVYIYSSADKKRRNSASGRTKVTGFRKRKTFIEICLVRFLTSRHSQENKLSAKGYCLARFHNAVIVRGELFPGTFFFENHMSILPSRGSGDGDIRKAPGFPRIVRNEIRRLVASNNQRRYAYSSGQLFINGKYIRIPRIRWDSRISGYL